MTNEQHIENLKKLKSFHNGSYGADIDRAIEALEQTRWIPVSERLPEAGEYIGDVARYYLVQNEYGDMLVARYTHGEYWEQIYQLKPIGDEIVAWMPLPNAYELESNGPDGIDRDDNG